MRGHSTRLVRDLRGKLIKERKDLKIENKGFPLYIGDGNTLIGRADIGFRKDGKLVLIEIDAPGSPIMNATKIWIYSTYKENPQESLIVFHFYPPDVEGKRESKITGEKAILEHIKEQIENKGNKYNLKCMEGEFSKENPSIVENVFDYIKWEL